MRNTTLWLVLFVPLAFGACWGDPAPTGDTDPDTDVDTDSDTDTAPPPDSPPIEAFGTSNGGGRLQGDGHTMNVVVGDPAAVHDLKSDEHTLTLGVGTIVRERSE